MSRAYRVKWETASKTVRSRDSLELGLDLLGILPESEMCDLLADELVADGWKKDHGTLALKLGTAHARLSDDKKTISLTLEQAVEVNASARTKDSANDEAERRSQSAKSRLDAETTKALGKAEADLRDAMNQAIQRTYRRALERRAGQLGEIESIQEGTNQHGDIEVTIKVKA